MLLDVSIQRSGYAANEPVIRDIDFHVKPGELIGVIGPNGEGKSTTIKTLLGLMEHWKGDVFFRDGATYGYIPERPIFYDELTLQEHIDFIAAVEEVDLETMSGERPTTSKHLEWLHMFMSCRLLILRECSKKQC
jgi:ABC-2 type transport system ATP-binding protein